MKKTLSIIILIIINIGLWAQTPITLNEVLETARQQSLDAFRAKNMYLADYWAFQSYKSRQLPHLNWQINPATYNRRMTMRYDYTNDVDVYREQQTLSSYTELSLSQNIVATGGNVYLESDIYRLQNYNDGNTNSWSTTPIRIGFNQPLFGYNRFKWEKKISPLKFEKSKQEYIQSVQQTNKKATMLYFNLILANVRRDIASNTVATSDTLYNIGLKRFDIASIQYDELLDLELSKFNAEIDLAQAEKSIEKTRFNLLSFLGMSAIENIEPLIPGTIDGLQVDLSTAFELAKKLNPKMMQLKQQELEGERNLERTIKNARFSANLNMSYGLNQSAKNFDGAYRNPLDQQVVSMSMNIPLVDWGDRKGQRHVAQNQKEIIDIEVKQSLLDFEQEIKLKVIDFNLQAKVVASAAKADELAQQSYELTKKRFILGKADVLKLTSSMSARQRSREKYINSLATYWLYFYEIQELTLYDFVNEQTLVEDFDKLIQE
ncbi:MAG: TolC family protein [Salinivirgaceae bacterium]|jgi:outer membrane protein TolC|nr:TolC family protein [Salinivirgaceae bacterium]